MRPRTTRARSTKGMSWRATQRLRQIQHAPYDDPARKLVEQAHLHAVSMRADTSVDMHLGLEEQGLLMTMRCQPTHCFGHPTYIRVCRGVYA